jgi:hypothetical protein
MELSQGQGAAPCPRRTWSEGALGTTPMTRLYPRTSAATSSLSAWC